MLEYGAFEAKTHFSQLLDIVQQGECITITRHGKPVAILCRAEMMNQLQTGDAFQKLRALREKAPIHATAAELAEWKQKGRP